MKTLLRLFSSTALAVGVGALVLVASGYATPSWAQASKAAVEETSNANDPLEPVNRFIFGFNQIFQKVVLRPATGMYLQLVPPAVREAIGHLIDNVKTPVILANDILQGEGHRAWLTTQRFMVNSTLGVGGLMDPATKLGIPKHSEDFGQTLAVWGVGEGFYLVLPFYGPSNPRDAVGKLLVDNYFDPLGMYLGNTGQDDATYGRMATEGVDEYGGVMDDLAQIKKTSVDYYAAIRSMYRQKRKVEINNGADVELPPIPNLGAQIDNGTGTGEAAAPRSPAGSDQVSMGRK